MSGRLSIQQVLDAAHKAGFRGDDLIVAAAVAYVESGFNSNAFNGNRGTGDQSYGLWQLNMIDSMGPSRRAAWGISTNDELFAAEANARGAYALYQSSGGNFHHWIGYRDSSAKSKYTSAVLNANLPGIASVARSMGLWNSAQGGGVGSDLDQAGGSIQVKIGRGETRNVDLGTLPDPTTVQIGSGTGRVTETGNIPLPSGADVSSTVGPSRIPGGGQVIEVNGARWVVYDFYDLSEGAPRIGFRIDTDVQLGQTPTTQMSQAEFDQMNLVDGGSAAELDSVVDRFDGPAGFQDMLNHVLDLTFGDNPARGDADVLRVMMEYVGRPDMTDQELDRLLQGTTWFQERTAGQLAWNDLSEAEQNQRVTETATRLGQVWFTYVGEAIDYRELAEDARKIASGEMGEGEWTESIAKQAALKNPDSPWARRLRDEEQAQNQYGVDVDNQTGVVRDLTSRWGIQWSDDALAEWGEKLAMGEASQQDLRTILQEQAQVLFPWKSPELETRTVAEPWVQTYRRVMEREVDLFDPSIQRALANGQGLADFEEELKMSDQWLSTSNARDTLLDEATSIGRRMGYV